MTIYAVLQRNPAPPWIGWADSPEGACEQARMQAKNPPRPNNVIVVIASEDQWVYIVHDVTELLEMMPKPTLTHLQGCPILGRYFVDYL